MSAANLALLVLVVLLSVLVAVLTVLLLRQRRLLHGKAGRNSNTNSADILAVEEAVLSIRTLKYPMALLPFDVFKQAGRLRPHEEMRAKLIFLDTYDQLLPFTRANPSVFFSHQWLSKFAPDPQGVHWRAMCAAGDELCARFSIPPEELMVWVEHAAPPQTAAPKACCATEPQTCVLACRSYTSIPQANTAALGLAVSSLGVYASSCRFFCIVAPPATKALPSSSSYSSSSGRVDSEAAPGDMCDLASYSRRGWCRLENLAALSLGGHRSMYLCDGDGDTLRPYQGMVADEMVRIFEGEFTNKDDKAPLGSVMLGLWSLALQSHRQREAKEREEGRRRRSGATVPTDAPASSAAGRALPSLPEEGASKNLLYQAVMRQTRERIFPRAIFGDRVALLEELMAHHESVDEIALEAQGKGLWGAFRKPQLGLVRRGSSWMRAYTASKSASRLTFRLSRPEPQTMTSLATVSAALDKGSNLVAERSIMARGFHRSGSIVGGMLRNRRGLSEGSTPEPSPKGSPPKSVRLAPSPIRRTVTTPRHLIQGQRVRHPTRGLGTIVKTAPGSRTVQFDRDEVADLDEAVSHTYKAHSFAKLMPITNAEEDHPDNISVAAVTTANSGALKWLGRARQASAQREAEAEAEAGATAEAGLEERRSRFTGSIRKSSVARKFSAAVSGPSVPPDPGALA